MRCPECGGSDRPIIVSRCYAVKRRCSECGHVAWTPRDVPAPGETPIAELLLRQDRTTVRVARERGELPQ